jgi:hypothetical protein
MTLERAGVWLAAFATISMYSYLFKDNIVFKVGEHIFIGFAAAHTVVMGVSNIIEMAWKPLTTKGDVMWVVPMLLGLLLYARFTRQHSWLSRWPLAYLMGIGAAVAIRGWLQGSFIDQIKATVLPLNSLDNIIIVVGVTTTLTYFFFVAGGRKGVLKHSAQIGRWTMMVAFGAAFGNTVMARMSLLIGRLQFLFGTWIPLIPKQ